MRVVSVVTLALWVSSASLLTTPPQSPPRVSPCPGCGFAPEPLAYKDVTGWTQIFDGKTLDGWDGNPAVWKVENGAITAESTVERRVGTTYVIWRGGEPADFELKLEVKADADIHGGIFYRGAVGPAPPRVTPTPRAADAPGAAPATPRPQMPVPVVPADPKWNVTGYSLDFDYARDNDGNIQDTGGRPEPQIGWRGNVVRMEAGQRPRVVGSVGDRSALMELIKLGDWNELHIIARGHQVMHIVNGQLMAVVIDDDVAARKTKGVIALQIEQYGAGRISFRNIWLKQ